MEGTKAGTTTKGRRLLTLLQTHIGDILTPLPLFPPVPIEPVEEQRVRLEQQRVIHNSPIITIPRITDAPGIMASRNPTAKQNIRGTPLVHKQHTRNNTPGGVPLIRRTKLAATEDAHATPAVATRTRSRIPMARTRLVSQHALNLLTMTETFRDTNRYTPRSFKRTHNAQLKCPRRLPHINFEHYANPMVHPITGKTISSYKKLMHDPATAEV